jgi:hypothetical protein
VPTYVFKDINTGELSEHVMSYTKLDDFKAQNPNLIRHMTSDNLPILSDGMRMSVPGIGKPDSTFEKYVIGRMKESIPGNTMGGHKTRGPREW